MNRRNLLKTFLAAPAIIRSGVLMPVVPLVVGPFNIVQPYQFPWMGSDLGSGDTTKIAIVEHIAKDDPRFFLFDHQWTGREVLAMGAERRKPLVFNRIFITKAEFASLYPERS